MSQFDTHKHAAPIKIDVGSPIIMEVTFDSVDLCCGERVDFPRSVARNRFNFHPNRFANKTKLKHFSAVHPFYI